MTNSFVKLIEHIRLVGLIVLMMIFMPLANSQPDPFRIGTGGSAGTYFPIGSLIAQGISGRPDSVQKDDFELPNLLALAQRSNGSAANVSDIGDGLLEAGLAQADVVHWAFNGAGPFSGAAPISNLRTIGTLYFESLHLVVRADSDIFEVKDLVGKLVSVDEIGSGTQLNVQHIISTQGLGLDDIKTVYLKPIDAIDRLRREQLDAFFVVAGYPVAGVSELIADGVGRIVPIFGPDIISLQRSFPFFIVDKIPANTYGIARDVETLAVPAQLVVSADLDDNLVYRIAGLLWSDETLKLLSEGHPKGSELNFLSALVGLSAPLHPGAEKYYQKHGHPYFSSMVK